MKNLQTIIENKFLIKKNVKEDKYVNPIDANWEQKISWDPTTPKDCERILKWLEEQFEFKDIQSAAGLKYEFKVWREPNDHYIIGYIPYKNNVKRSERYLTALYQDKLIALGNRLGKHEIFPANPKVDNRSIVFSKKLANDLGMSFKVNEEIEFLTQDAKPNIKNGEFINAV